MSLISRSILVGLITAAVCLGTVAWISARESEARRADLELQTDLAVQQLMGRIRARLETHGIAVLQMANYFENSEMVREDEFNRFASHTLSHSPLCERISIVDESFHIRWVYPGAYEPDVAGFDTRSHPEGFEVIQRVKDKDTVAMSSPLRLLDGEDGFLIATPIGHGENFSGEVVCAIRTQDFFDTVILPASVKRYNQEILDGEILLHAQREKAPPHPAAPVVELNLRYGGRQWRARVSPHHDVTTAQVASGREAFWIMGGLLALAFGVALAAASWRSGHMARRLSDQNRALLDTRQQLDGAQQQLIQAEKLTALGELVAGVAHEINNPLASVIGYTQLVLRKELPPEVTRRLETVCSEAERAGKIVKNLLTFARKHPPERILLGLNGIIEKTLELKSYQFRVNQIAVETALSPGLPPTLLDFHQFQQVLLNLLNNAEQAMGEKGSRGTLKVATRMDGDEIELRITDTGPGIPPEVRARIFEPFFTTKKDGKGTGLGLSMCYGIVKEHGGEIRAEESPGGGASFVIHLPVVNDAAASEKSAGAESEQAGLSILVVDDDESVVRLMVDLFRTDGHRVDTASDASEGIGKIGNQDYDLIIADMKMPHGTGRDIYEAVARTKPRLARRIVFTTGEGSSRETLSFFKEKGNEIIQKPCKIEEIERIMSRVARRRDTA